jgi:hypothetical protein
MTGTPDLSGSAPSRPVYWQKIWGSDDRCPGNQFFEINFELAWA